MEQKHINEIREFNRFYTRIIGLLDKYILSSHLTLPEVRVLYELYHNNKMTASEITSYLQMDKGYLSRMLKQFDKKNMLQKVPSTDDKRSTYITLSKYGKSEFEKLNKASNDQISNIFGQLSNSECEEVIIKMNSIKTILSKIKG